MTVIRGARPGDHAQLLELARQTWKDAFGHSMSESDVTAHLENELSDEWLEVALKEDVFLLAEGGQRLVGYVQIGAMTGGTPNCDPATTWEIVSQYVLQEYQNRGLGTSLLRAALEHPSVAGAWHFSLDVWDQNAGAIRFYERHGFKIVGARAFEVASGAETDPDLIMLLDRNASGGGRP